MKSGVERAEMDREGQIRKVLRELVDDPASIDVNESMLDTGALDSFSLTALVAALEREFQIKVPDSDLIPQRFESIGRIQNYLASRLDQ
jgi:acyl carrier protein